MSLADELTDALIDGYKRAGEEVGYWGHRYLRSIRNNGAVATATRMLRPRNTDQRKGLYALLDAGRTDLTLEAIILQPRFRTLFSPAELKEAAERLGQYGKDAAGRLAKRERLYPDELEPGQSYF